MTNLPVLIAHGDEPSTCLGLTFLEDDVDPHLSKGRSQPPKASPTCRGFLNQSDRR